MRRVVSIINKIIERKRVQVPREINIESILDGQMVTQQLQRNDIQNPLQAIYRLRDPDRLAFLGDAIIVNVAHDNRLCFPSRDLGIRRLDLGVKRILSHDDDNRHILVNEGERSVLEFSREDTLRMHVGYFLDLQCTFETRGISVR